MPSSFAWLDVSADDRRRALDLVASLCEKGTLDELGLGTIRDAFADRFFPGTSTLQTRVRYFLFLPWILRALHPANAREDRFEAWLRRSQESLRASLERGGEKRGVIGRVARESLQVLPSRAYWSGLQRWRILQFDGSEEDYARAVLCGQTGAAVEGDDGEHAGEQRRSVLWDPALGDEPRRWRSETTFALRREEADYLRQRIASAAPDSLLAHLVTLEVDPAAAEFVWEVPSLGGLPGPLAAEVEHARCFSEVMHGAALLYNWLLANAKGDAELRATYAERLDEWEGRIEARRAELNAWDRPAFLKTLVGWGARVRPATQRFVTGWTDEVLGPRRGPVAARASAQKRVRRREVECKARRARLGNRKALAEWEGGSGDGQIDYRWGRPVRSLLADLRDACWRGA